MPDHGIRAGHIPTQLEVDKLIEDLAEVSNWTNVDLFAYRTNDEDDEPDVFVTGFDYIALWVNRAPSEALGPLLVAMDKIPPLRAFPNDETEPLSWLLGRWGEVHPHPWAEEIMARLEIPEKRPLAFACMHGQSVFLPKMEFWSVHVNELDEAGQLSLIDAIVNLAYSDDPRRLLRSIQESLLLPTPLVSQVLDDAFDFNDRIDAKVTEAARQFEAVPQEPAP